MPDIKKARINKELKNFSKSPPKGILLYPKDDDINNLKAEISSLEGTPYEAGVFKLHIEIPSNYPFTPPQMRFSTPVYHPNIDDAGRICLDVLKDTEHGAWKPSMSLSTLLLSIQMLLREPNPDDPLMPDIAEEFKGNRSLFDEKAKQHTNTHASPQAHAARKCAEPVEDVLVEQAPSIDSSSRVEATKVASKLGKKRKLENPI